MSILQRDALLALFCSVDDFCHDFLPQLKARLIPDKKRRNRARSLSESENRQNEVFADMTILIAFHQSQFRNFKALYLGFVHNHWHKAFPHLVSYSRFIEHTPSVVVALFAYLKSLFGKCTGTIAAGTSFRLIRRFYGTLCLQKPSYQTT